MTKQHFEWAAKEIIDECKFNGLYDYQMSLAYIHYTLLFKQFAPKFDIQKFDKYIVSRLYN